MQGDDPRYPRHPPPLSPYGNYRNGYSQEPLPRERQNIPSYQMQCNLILLPCLKGSNEANVL